MTSRGTEVVAIPTAEEIGQRVLSPATSSEPPTVTAERAPVDPSTSHDPAPAAEQSQAKGSYLPEIDGLRAIAVIAVMINHFHKGVLRSGYLGVDVFFAISGYVITASLLSSSGTSARTLLTTFYSRRMKRLVPAMLVTVLVGSMLISLFDPAPQKSLTVGRYALFGLANVALLRHAADYFAQSTEYNMFTHMWSLGVEEQFYLAFPLIVLLCRSRKSRAVTARNLTIVMGLTSAASLLMMLRMRTLNPARAYFFMPARFWEIGVGCLLVAWLAHRSTTSPSGQAVWAWAARAKTTALIGLFAVMFSPESMTTAATVAAVALTVVVLHAVGRTPASASDPATRLLRSGPAVFIGRISYSLYLWHWIVLVTARWTIGVSLRTAPFLVFLSFLLAWMSYIVVEQPLRHAPWFRRRTLTIITALCLCGASLSALNVIGKRDAYLGDTAAPALPGCFQPEGFVWLFGDSHGEALSPALQMATEGRCTQRIRLPETGSALLLDHGRWADGKGGMLSDIRLRSPDSTAALVKAGRPGAIVSDAYLVGYFGPQPSPFKSADWPVIAYYDETGKQIDRIAALNQYTANVTKFAATIAPTKLLLMLPGPDFDWVGRGGPSDGCRVQWYHFGRSPTANGCDVYHRGAKIPVAQAEARRADVVARLRSIAAASPNVVLYDPFPVLCPGGVCSTHSPGGALLYRDDDHIGTGAQQLLAPELRGVLTANGMLPP